MGIFDRMGKVISSNFNSLLDKAEDDKKILELNVEEMGDQLKAARQEVISAIAAEKQLKKKAEDLDLMPNDIIDVPTSGSKSFLRGLLGTVAPSVAQLPVRIVP